MTGPEMPPEAVAQLDQGVAAAEEYLDMLRGIYRGALGEVGEVQAFGALVAVAKTQRPEVLHALLATAVRRLELGQQPSPG